MTSLKWNAFNFYNLVTDFVGDGVTSVIHLAIPEGIHFRVFECMMDICRNSFEFPLKMYIVQEGILSITKHNEKYLPTQSSHIYFPGEEYSYSLMKGTKECPIDPTHEFLCDIKPNKDLTPHSYHLQYIFEVREQEECPPWYYIEEIDVCRTLQKCFLRYIEKIIPSDEVDLVISFRGNCFNIDIYLPPVTIDEKNKIDDRCSPAILSLKGYKEMYLIKAVIERTDIE